MAHYAGVGAVTIDPTEEFALVELERMKWFLGSIDLTKDEVAGIAIQDAYGSIGEAIKQYRRTKKGKS